jgi:opacity protein-like surface antigen
MPKKATKGKKKVAAAKKTTKKSAAKKLAKRTADGTFVLGIEGDANAKSGSASYAYYDTNFYRAESFNGTVSQGWDGSVRGRAGFLVAPTTLAYGTVGAAFGSVSGSFGQQF